MKTFKLLFIALFLLPFSLLSETVSYEYKTSGGTWLSYSRSEDLEALYEDYIAGGTDYGLYTTANDGYSPVRNVKIDGVPMLESGYILEEFETSNAQYSHILGYFVTAIPAPPPPDEWYELTTPAFPNDTQSDVQYYWEVQFENPSESLNGENYSSTETIPPNHNMIITGVEGSYGGTPFSNFAVRVYRITGSDAVSAGVYFPQYHTAPYGEGRASENVVATVTEGLVAPIPPSYSEQPQQPKADDYVTAETRKDKTEEEYDPVGILPGEAGLADVVEAIKDHDHNRQEEHLSNEHMWTESEENQNDRFDGMNEAMQGRHEETTAWLSLINTINASGHGDTSQSLIELRAAVDGHFQDDGTTPVEHANPISTEGQTGDGDDWAATMGRPQLLLSNAMGLIPSTVNTFPSVSGRKYQFTISAPYQGYDLGGTLDLTPYTSLIEMIRSLVAAILIIIATFRGIDVVKGAFA
ncbi:hypothetical protein [Cerasicoccus fimbriatus]|uniref:hypothetical protein n=1 Tax=Cerasicoccus fimbriatus TaxID=3014554 RepID=UPI0022B45AA6|nr:hypothetical protein [Cerasicoccus sp. TK19100]